MMRLRCLLVLFIMVDLLVGNSLYSVAGSLGLDAWRVRKTALYSGKISELRVDFTAMPYGHKFALYDTNGTRLWYMSGYPGSSGDNTQIVVSPNVEVVQGSYYHFYLALQTTTIKYATSGIDYDLYYTTSLSFDDTPPSDLFSGISWSASSRRDFAVRAYGTISSGLKVKSTIALL